MSEDATLRSTELDFEHVSNLITKLRREEGLQTSPARRIVEFILEEAIIGQFEVLLKIKDKRLNGIIKDEEIDEYLPKLRLAGQALSDIVTTYLVHDTETHRDES